MYLGNEPLRVGGGEIALTVHDFWRWAYSGLSDDATRNAFAEFLVASSLDLVSGGQGRAPCLLWTPSGGAGIRVSVQAAAFVQSEDGEYPDHIVFRLPAPDGGESFDVRVFCVFRAMTPGESPLNTDLWDFYTLRERDVREWLVRRRKLPLPALMGLEPVWCDYYGIGGAIREALTV